VSAARFIIVNNFIAAEGRRTWALTDDYGGWGRDTIGALTSLSNCAWAGRSARRRSCHRVATFDGATNYMNTLFRAVDHASP
jgi:hypothetical protein